MELTRTPQITKTKYKMRGAYISPQEHYKDISAFDRAQRRKREIEKEKEIKELEGCTFSPNNAKHTKPIDVSRLYDWEEKRRSKIVMMAMSQVPPPFQKRRRSSPGLVDRLYKEAVQLEEKKERLRGQMNEGLFHPRISQRSRDILMAKEKSKENADSPYSIKKVKEKAILNSRELAIESKDGILGRSPATSQVRTPNRRGIQSTRRKSLG